MKGDCVNIIIYGYYGKPDKRMNVPVMKRRDRYLIIRVGKWSNATLYKDEDGTFNSWTSKGGPRRKEISLDEGFKGATK